MTETRKPLKPGVEVIRPPGLAAKVPTFGGPDPSSALRQAEKAIAHVASEFAATIPEELDALDALLVEYKAAPGGQTLEKLFRRVHNLRGQGTTMGFPLITRIGSSFCRYMIERDETKQVNADLIEKHLQALRIVLRERKAGNGDALATQVAEALETVVERELKA